MQATALVQRQMTTAEAFAEIVARRISVTCCLDGKLWSASADIKGDRNHNRKRAIRAESAIASSLLQAVEQLVAKLGSRADQVGLWEGGDA